jgi:hypothetical protein
VLFIIGVGVLGMIIVVLSFFLWPPLYSLSFSNYGVFGHCILCRSRITVSLAIVFSVVLKLRCLITPIVS